MLSQKLLAIVAVIWVIGVLLGSTFSYSNTSDSWAGTSTGQSYTTNGYGQYSDLGYLLKFSNAFQKFSAFGTDIPLPVPNPNYFKVMFGVLTLRFSFLVSNPVGEMFWAIFLMPFSLMGVVGIVMTFLSIIRGNITWN
jgi:hypothetical protein